MLKQKEIIKEEQCFHCGEDIASDLYHTEGKGFCCLGCKTVYQILEKHNLSSYYAYNDVPGKTQNATAANLDYLNVESIVDQLVDYQDQKVTVITLYILPLIHI